MAKRRDPGLRRHASGQYFVRIRGKNVYLGTDKEAAEAERLQVLLAMKKTGSARPSKDTGGETVDVLTARFLKEHAEKYYRKPDGTPTSEFANLIEAFKPLTRILGPEPVAEITADRLEAVRDAMTDHSWKTSDERDRAGRPGWCLNFVNQNLGRIKRMFRWGFKKKIVPAAVWAELSEVDGLPEGRGYARETEDVLPAPQWAIDATIPRLAPCPRAMCQIMLLTGMRPGEMRRLKPGDIDRTGERLRLLLGGTNPGLAGCWVYLPGSGARPDRTQHKMAHRGKKAARVHRVVPIPPAAQKILEPWLDGVAPDQFVFTPHRSMAIRRKERRDKRQTRVQPSQISRAGKSAKRRPGRGCYTIGAFAASVRKAIERLNRDRKEKGEPLIPLWHPHQLRHNVGHFLESKFGYPVARMVLGHKSLQATKIYARGDLEAAFKAMGEAG